MASNRKHAGRIPALDALRGGLATIVVAQHVLEAFDLSFFSECTHIAVLGFFVMSGYVLARSFEETASIYMLKRLIRLWPLYMACVTVGSLELGTLPTVKAALFWPLPSYPHNLPAADPPAWSLIFEAWAIPLSPVLFRLCHHSRVTGLALALMTTPLVYLTGNPLLDCIPAFVLGAALAEFDIRLPPRAPPALLVRLGHVSYSLYLTHGLVMMEAVRLWGRWGSVFCLPALIPTAYASWWAIERPSMILSRRIKSTSPTTSNEQTEAPAG